MSGRRDPPGIVPRGDRGAPGVLGPALCGVAGVAGRWSRRSGHGQVRGAARSGGGQGQHPVESARLRGRLLEPPLARGRPGQDDVDDRDALQARVLQGPTDRAGDVACPQPARRTVAEPITVSPAGVPARSARADARGLGPVPEQHQPVALPPNSGDLERGLGDVTHQHGVAVAQHGQRAVVRRHGHRHRDELGHDRGGCGGGGCGGSRRHLLGCPDRRMGQRHADQVVGLGRNDHGEGRSDRALGHRRRVVRRRRGEQAGTRPRGLGAAPPRQSIERRCAGIGVGGLLQVLLRGQRKQVDLRTARHRRPRCGLTHLKSKTHLKSEAVRHAPISPVRAEHATLIRRRHNPDGWRRRPFCRPVAAHVPCSRGRRRRRSGSPHRGRRSQVLHAPSRPRPRARPGGAEPPTRHGPC